MILRILAILLGICATATSQAEIVKILECQSQHSPFDPDFVQGSETFGDVYFNSETRKASLEMSSMEKGRATLYSFEQSLKVNFSIELSSGYFDWWVVDQKDYASLVFLGSRWGFVVEVSETHPNLAWRGTEIEMMCSETESFEWVLK